MVVSHVNRWEAGEKYLEILYYFCNSSLSLKLSQNTKYFLIFIFHNKYSFHNMK